MNPTNNTSPTPNPLPIPYSPDSSFLPPLTGYPVRQQLPATFQNAYSTSMPLPLFTGHMHRQHQPFPVTSPFPLPIPVQPLPLFSNPNSSYNPNLIWTEHTTPEGITYYFNKTSQQSVWEKPPGFKSKTTEIQESQPVPVSWEQIAETDWKKVVTETGEVYYHNTVTSVSTWTVPPELSFLDQTPTKQPTPSTTTTSTTTTTTTATTTSTTETKSEEAKEGEEGRQKEEEKGEEEEEEERMLTKAEVQQIRVNAGLGGLTPAAEAVAAAVAAAAPSALEAVKRKLTEASDLSTSLPLPKRLKEDNNTNTNISTSSTSSNSTSGTTSTTSTTSPPPSSDVTDGSSGPTPLSPPQAPEEEMAESPGSDGPAHSSKEEVEALKEKQKQIEVFKTMLREKGITPFSKWDKDMPKLVFDPRFQVIPISERKGVFEAFVKNRTDEQRQEKRALQKAKLDAFNALLDEHASLFKADATLEQLKTKLEKDKRWKGVDPKERTAILTARLQPLKAAEASLSHQKKEQFLQMLKELSSSVMNRASRWYRIKDLIKSDPRYKAILSESEKEALFHSHLKSLLNPPESSSQQPDKKAASVIREREKEVGKMREREKRELRRKKISLWHDTATSTFTNLLTEKIKKPEISWEEAQQILVSDSRFDCVLSPEEKESIFQDHLNSFYENRRKDFRTQLIDLYQSGKIDVAATWPKVQPLIAEMKGTKLSEKEQEEVFELFRRDIVTSVKTDFVALLREAKILLPYPPSAASYEKAKNLLQGDQRWTALDGLPEDREKLVMEYDSRTHPDSSRKQSDNNGK
eukprot:TRINITY_DN2882_c0_g1_i1.p1 TRINITY_DN2882_c0_g1~~TRINITY_DN2882_c0_g1_i1.p1  ORF type:complete len:805 (-),score=233.01 TRINITY_DN2882_c0_g1_i1:29-2443(-)